MSPEFTALDAALRAAAIRDDRDQERLLEQAATALQTPPAPFQASTLQVALWYANRGLPVFPVKPGEKRPFERTRGLHDATTSPDQLTTWFGTTAGEKYNLGIPTGGLFDVVDLDGPEGAQAFIDMVGTGPDAGNWLTVRGVVQTPHGLHLWVPAVEGAQNLQNGGTHVDYRAKGGYVVVPPSHLDGTVYRWLLPPVL